MTTDIHFQSGCYPDTAAWLTSELRDELQKVTAERDRLKAALVRLGTHTNISAGERLMIVQEALGGDA